MQGTFNAQIAPLLLVALRLLRPQLLPVPFGGFCTTALLCCLTLLPLARLLSLHWPSLQLLSHCPL